MPSKDTGFMEDTWYYLQTYYLWCQFVTSWEWMSGDDWGSLWVWYPVTHFSRDISAALCSKHLCKPVVVFLDRIILMMMWLCSYRSRMCLLNSRVLIFCYDSCQANKTNNFFFLACVFGDSTCSVCVWREERRCGSNSEISGMFSLLFTAPKRFWKMLFKHVTKPSRG